jgi:hypothetical protein
MTSPAAANPVRLPWPVLVGTALWLILMAAVLITPYAVPSPTPEDDLIRYTVRVALLYYTAAGVLMLLLKPEEWTARSGRGATARWFWTLAWTAFLVHLVMAFHHAHHWSHADAVAHTEEMSGFGPGIYLSHLFTVVWTADVVFWWCCPRRYAKRSPWVDRLLHGFMAFMIFNGTVVFEDGLIRWAGIGMFVVLLGALVFRFMQSEHRATTTAQGPG